MSWAPDNRGTKEYNEKARLRKIKAILNEHQENIRATAVHGRPLRNSYGAWGDLLPGPRSVLGAYQSIKGNYYIHPRDLSESSDVPGRMEVRYRCY